MTEYEDDATGNEPSGSQLKVVGRLADQCQDALVQLGTFLASSHAPDEYAARLPPLQVPYIIQPIAYMHLCTYIFDAVVRDVTDVTLTLHRYIGRYFT